MVPSSPRSRSSLFFIAAASLLLCFFFLQRLGHTRYASLDREPNSPVPAPAPDHLLEPQPGDTVITFEPEKQQIPHEEHPAQNDEKKPEQQQQQQNEKEPVQQNEQPKQAEQPPTKAEQPEKAEQPPAVQTEQSAQTEQPTAPSQQPQQPQQPQQSQPPREPICPQILGAEDVLVVMKTGASEVQQKLPVHLETTFRCVPHFAVFSDLEEEVAGVHVHDTLDQVSEQIKQTNPDFQFYHQLREYRAAGRNVSDLVQGSSQPAWNLDRWKFLPLMEKALKTRPESKWFLFIEADTAIVWSNLLEWLQHFDSSKPYYIGGQSWVGEHQFGHGGTGFVVSNPALRMLVEKRAQNLDSFDQLTANTWVGDLVLGEAFETVGIYLTPAWPTLQGETPYSLDYTEHHWCYPVVSWHHMPPEWIKAVWEFEQEWLGSVNKLPAIRHRDIFAHFVWPYIQQERQMWDNLSDDFEETPLEYTEDGCRAACDYRLECVQWLYTEGRCQTGAVIKLGGEVEEGGLNGTSGWVMERIQLFMQNVEPCHQDWIVA